MVADSEPAPAPRLVFVDGDNRQTALWQAVPIQGALA